MRKHTFLVTAIVALATAAAIGCSESSQTSATPPAAQKPKSAVTSTIPAKISEEKNVEVYTYNPAGRKDPFSPIVTKGRDLADGPGVKAPLERYPITEFKLAGIVWGGFGYNAMVEGPDGKGYFIRQGTVIGPNHGIVKKINSNSLIIDEKYKSFNGETAHREIVIELRKKQEGTP